jgi:hypothetical protein
MAKKTKKNNSLGIMTTGHPRWNEFASRLDGPEGCNFRYEPPTEILKNLRWNCSPGGPRRPLSRKILAAMGASAQDITSTLAYFSENGAHCDCEVLFNVDK